MPLRTLPPSPDPHFEITRAHGPRGLASRWFLQGFQVSQKPEYDIPTEDEIRAGRERERQLIAEAERMAQKSESQKQGGREICSPADLPVFLY